MSSKSCLLFCPSLRLWQEYGSFSSRGSVLINTHVTRTLDK